MEGMQLAQMLADLSDLHAAEEDAARALVTVNKTIAHMETNKPLPKRAVEHPELQQVRTSSPATLLAGGLDKFGRRIMTPPMTRTNSSSSMPGTPRRELDDHDEVERASTLMALYDIRAKLKQQDNTSLLKAREKINALALRQQLQQQQPQPQQQHSSYPLERTASSGSSTGSHHHHHVGGYGTSSPLGLGQHGYAAGTGSGTATPDIRHYAYTYPRPPPQQQQSQPTSGQGTPTAGQPGSPS